MNVNCEVHNQICVLSVAGDFSGEACGHVRTTVEDRIDNRQMIDFVVDLEKCEFIDSEGLEALLWIKRRAEELFGQFKLANVDETCRKILEITRLERRFDCPGDLAAAFKSMR
jgi:anti-sigma B factor antagonist